MIFNYKYSWQSQFFDKFNNQKTALTIPLSDSDAYRFYPNHSWVYNKLSLMEKLNYICAPHGIYPSKNDFPVISKPITNLTGMGAGISFSENNKELDYEYTPGHFWTKQFFGDHISMDIVINNGMIIWHCATEGIPDPDRIGAFESWNILPDFTIPLGIVDFFKKHFSDFKGIVNVELIGNYMIEMHLRMSSQWIDLNGSTWTQDLIDFYLYDSLNIQKNKPKGHSVPLFLDTYPECKLTDTKLDQLTSEFDLSSIQVTYDINNIRNRNSMPPGGVRVAIINSINLENALMAKAAIKAILLTAI